MHIAQHTCHYVSCCCHNIPLILFDATILQSSHAFGNSRRRPWLFCTHPVIGSEASTRSPRARHVRKKMTPMEEEIATNRLQFERPLYLRVSVKDSVILSLLSNGWSLTHSTAVSQLFLVLSRLFSPTICQGMPLNDVTF